MDRDECGCPPATSINDLCPECRAEYEEYLNMMAMLRKSVAEADRKEVERADAA